MKRFITIDEDTWNELFPTESAALEALARLGKKVSFYDTFIPSEVEKIVGQCLARLNVSGLHLCEVGSFAHSARPPSDMVERYADFEAFMKAACPVIRGVIAECQNPHHPHREPR